MLAARIMRRIKETSARLILVLTGPLIYPDYSELPIYSLA